MIRCGVCGQLTKPGEQTFERVIRQRAKVYEERWRADDVGTPRLIDKGGSGHETAQAIRVCRTCNVM